MSYQVRHKQGCTATEDCKRLEISDVGSRGIVLYDLCSENKEGLYYIIYMYVATPKARISCAVTVQLICVFVFTYDIALIKIFNFRL